MSYFNKVILIGRVTATPEMRYTAKGTPVSTFTIAVDRSWKGTDGKEKETDFITIVAWQKLAEICSQYLTKGKLICIEGRLQTRTYSTASGEKRKVYEVVASDMRMLGRPKGDGADEPGSESSLFMSEPDKDFDQLGVHDVGIEDDVPF